MGAQWKQAGREINAQKKGQMTAKLVREIMVAAKLGGPDPTSIRGLLLPSKRPRKPPSIATPSSAPSGRAPDQTEEKVNFELVTYEGFRAAQGPGHRRVSYR